MDSASLNHSRAGLHRVNDLGREGRTTERALGGLEARLLTIGGILSELVVEPEKSLKVVRGRGGERRTEKRTTPDFSDEPLARLEGVT